MKIYNSIKYNFKNSFHVRMLTLFSFILLISLTSIISIFVIQQNKMFKHTNKTNYEHTLNQFRIYSDNYILEQVYRITTKDILHAPYFEIDFLFEDDSYIHNPNDFRVALDIIAHLYNSHTTVDFIESMSIYSKVHDTLIDSRLGAFYNLFDSRNNYEEFICYDTLEYLNSTSESQSWVPYDITKSFYQDQYITSFIQHIPMFVGFEDSNLVLIVNINLEKAYRNYISSIDLGKESFKVLNSQGQLLFDTSMEHDILPLEKILDSPSGSLHMEYQNLDTYITWNTSTLNDWIYIYTAIDNHTIFTSFYPTPILVFGILIILLFCLIATFYISKWLYKPLSSLVISSKDYLGIQTEEDDLSVIHDAFFTLDTKLENLQSLVDKNDTLISNNTLIDIINGEIEDLELLNNRLQILNKRFEISSFYFLIIKIEDEDFKNYISNDRDMLHLTGLTIINGFFDSQAPNVLGHLTRFNYDGYFISLTNTSSEPKLKDLNKLLSSISETLDNSFNLAISDLFTNLTLSSSSYKQTLDSLKYSYIYGSNNIFTPSLISEYEKKDLDLKQDILSRLEKLLVSHKFDELKEQLNLLSELIKSNRYSYLYTYNLFIQFISIIDRQCKVQNVYHENLHHVKLLEDFSKFHSLNNLITWLNELIDTFASIINARNESLNSTLVHEIQHYITSNIDDQLSLNPVAIHFNISPGHLSRIFKENTGETFSDFITRSKFEKATRLLVEQPNLKISQISSQLGYANVAYFTKLFKERYSMTPTQYRKLNT